LLVAFAINAWLSIGRFRALQSDVTIDRVAFYRSGLVRSLILFGGGAVVTLILLKRTDALVTVPEVFGAEVVRSVLSGVPAAWVYGVIAVWVGVICLASLMGGLQMKRIVESGAEMPNGALGALLPRTGRERGWGFWVSLNAGLSEELFFRLALPLLLLPLVGDGGLAFWLAILIFGLGHIYQGVWGIVMTTIVGAVLGFVYLYSGNIWLAVAIHAGIDLWSLVVMPVLIGWNRTAPPGA
jgi:membrane protease YdiL (CAAX protease family)